MHIGDKLRRSNKTKFHKKDPAGYKRMVTEVLAADVRSKFQTGKLREGGFEEKGKGRGKDKSCRQIIDGLVVVFEVVEGAAAADAADAAADDETAAVTKSNENKYDHKTAAKGSGCDDLVIVRRVELLE